MSISFKNLCYLEDVLFKMPGLYFLWTCLFAANLVAFLTDDVVGPPRDFLLFTSLISVIYPAYSVHNQLNGNKMPSTLCLTMGPIHQFSFWLLLAYFGGDVYGGHEIGAMNTVSTVVVGAFSLGLFFQSWLFVLKPGLYEEYVTAFQE